MYAPSSTEASSVLGWMSIACWIIVYSPQLLENYTLQSGEGLSVLFVITWLVGDLASMIGSSMAGLIPTVIILAIYYTACDTVLMGQIYYYRYKHRHGRHHHPTEISPLLPQEGEPSASAKPKWREILLGRPAQYFFATSFVFAAGFLAWYLDPGHSDSPSTGDQVFEWKSQVLGWTSAVLYIGSRIPQIIKNAQTKCAGLSLALFVFALGGNLTYVLSILVVSTSKRYLIANASWLAGSGLTMFLDFFVLYQFYHYRASPDVLPEELAA